MLLGTKAETLERLETVIRSASVLPLIRFTVKEWLESRDRIIKRVTGLPASLYIVRSSALSEDGEHESQAGAYLSVPHVRKNKFEIIKAINQVIESYGEPTHDEHQVFVQPMLTNVKLSGVAFSCDPNTGGPYYVINYSESGKDTDSVTGGYSNDLKVFYLFKNISFNEKVPPELKNLVLLIRELEQKLGTDSLDIEFAVTENNQLYLFQVRPLVHNAREALTFTEYHHALIDITDKFRKINSRHPYLYGKRTVLGIMPDWNPAEIIGVRPKPLALSLYKNLITDHIWAYQRDNYGYKNLRSFPLLIDFHGLPYIDVRVSFNSFIPRDISDLLSEKLANYYIDRLVEFPYLHDKVEFEIIFSCYTLDLPNQLSKLAGFGFNSEEIFQLTESLRNLTNNIINHENGLWKKDIAKIKILEARRTTILESSLDTVSKIYWLLEDCKRYGTLPFAGLARAGFIAVQLLKSMVNVGIINQHEYDQFMASVETIGSQITADFNVMDKEGFVRRYGHLRPGTYDLNSPRYDEDPDRYFDWKQRKTADNGDKAVFNLNLNQLKRIQSLLAEHKLQYDILGLFDFIKEAIEGREYSKFVFTRSLSDILVLFKKFGEEHGFSGEECSYSDISIISGLYGSSLRESDELKHSIVQGRSKHKLTERLTLPPLIVSEEDIWGFELPKFTPNFITLNSFTGPVKTVDASANEIAGSIVLIPNADPGYDWIFSHQIGGLITMYGGMNSHMAIRCGELGIPAVIGAGEALFQYWSKAKCLQLDCANRQVQVIQP